MGERNCMMSHALPEYIVEAGSLNIFKNSLDRLWSNQDLLYNYSAIEKYCF